MRLGLRLLLTAALGTVLAGALPPVLSAAVGTTIPPIRECADLAGDFGLPSGTAHVTAARAVPADAGRPAYCEVRGFVDTAVNFQLRLPIDTYAGRYLQLGCGGICGAAPTPAFPECGGSPGTDMAVASTDDGHVGGPPIPNVDGRWAADDQAARDDFFFRAPHVVSQAAKHIIAGYYGAPPRHAYFTGCSNGGREGLLLAQRYPDDFDGIVAGAPAHLIAHLAAEVQTWLARSNVGPAGEPILTSAKLAPLHEAVLAACDRLDGLADRLLDDPRTCRFDPASVACPSGVDRADCLTADQVGVVRRVYAGPADDAGHRLYPGGQLYGSELGWDAWVVPSPQFGGLLSAQLSDNYLRYLGYPIGSPHSSLADFRFTLPEFRRLTPIAVRANAMSTDLSRFRRAGGKLILWHGWSDPSIPPAGTLDYYARLEVRDGGPARTGQYARVFMVPSLYHCSGGSRLTGVDPLPEIVRWVEHGSAPLRILAEGRDAAGTVVRARPVFAYPLRAEYDGSGSPDDPGNYVPAAPATAPHDLVHWAGDHLYGRPGPVAP